MEKHRKLQGKACNDSQSAAEMMRKKDEQELRIPRSYFASWGDVIGQR